MVSSCFEELRLDALRAPPRPPRPALRPRRAGALASSVIPPRSSSSEGDFPGTLSVPAAARASRSAAVPVVRAPTCAPTARRRPAPPGAELLLADIAAASAAENVTTSAASAEASDPPRPRAAAGAPVRRRTGAARTCLCPGPSPAIPATQRRSAQAHFRDHRPGRFSLVQGAFERGSPVDASSAWSSGEVSGGANSFFLFRCPLPEESVPLSLPSANRIEIMGVEVQTLKPGDGKSFPKAVSAAPFSRWHCGACSSERLLSTRLFARSGTEAGDALQRHARVEWPGAQASCALAVFLHGCARERALTVNRACTDQCAHVPDAGHTRSSTRHTSATSPSASPSASGRWDSLLRARQRGRSTFSRGFLGAAH